MVAAGYIFRVRERRWSAIALAPWTLEHSGICPSCVRMPRYFFHIEDGCQVVIDSRDEDFPDESTACEAAEQLAES
jgi:hypothetical protein